MKILLLFIGLTFLSLGSVAQERIPLDSFYTPGSKWTEVASTTYYPCSDGQYDETIGIVYKIERDTIISGVKYHLMSSCQAGDYNMDVECESGTVVRWADSSTCNGNAPIFAMIRTDSNRVYFTLLSHQADPSNTYDCDSVGVEYLFYDFNLSIGSTVADNTVANGISVSTIDSVSLSNGINVARYNGTLLYGIGSQQGYIKYWNLYVCGPGPDASQFLLCYDNPNFSYHFSYPAGTLPGDLQYDCFDMQQYLDVKVITSTSFLSKLNVYPDPASDQLHIENSEPISSIMVNDLVGRRLSEFNYGTGTNEAKRTLDVSALPAGVYLLRVNNKEITKFIKTGN